MCGCCMPIEKYEGDKDIVNETFVQWLFIKEIASFLTGSTPSVDTIFLHQ